MAITTRAGKTSALTHDELDANFTTLGLAHGDTVANLDVSKIIINATESGSDPRLQAQGVQYDSVRFMRTGQTGATAKSTGLFVTEYTDAGHTAGQGTGYWTRIKTTDKESHGGAVITAFESVTDSNNWTAALEFRPVKSTSGTEDFNTTVLSVSQDKVVFKDTDRVEISTQIPMRLVETHADDLPSPAVKGDVLFLGFDGADPSVYHGKLIYFTGTQWNFVHDDSQVTT